jgi:hypothetical protein
MDDTFTTVLTVLLAAPAGIAAAWFIARGQREMTQVFRVQVNGGSAAWPDDRVHGIQEEDRDHAWGSRSVAPCEEDEPVAAVERISPVVRGR